MRKIRKFLSFVMCLMMVTTAFTLMMPAIVKAPAPGEEHYWWSGDGNNLNNILMPPVFNFSYLPYASLNFWHRHDIEIGDFGYVEVSMDGGLNWTEIGTYNGSLSDWTQVTLDLSSYLNMTIQLRFRYETDNTTYGEGWSVDDISVPEIGFLEDTESGVPPGWVVSGWTIVEKPGGYGGEAIVGFYGALPYNNQDMVKKIAAKYGITVKDTNPWLCAALYENVSDETLTWLQKDENVKYVERNHLRRISIDPNDPSYGMQWAPPHIGAPDAWDIVTGDPADTIIVAVIDTGINYNHPDIATNYVTGGYDWVNDDNDPLDDHGHGTHCAGIIAAIGNNGATMAGMAWEINIMAEKVMDSSGSGSDWDISQGIVHARNMGAKIISMSVGGEDPSDHYEQTVRYARNHGSLLVGASGNGDGSPVEYPAKYPEVMAVGAIDENNQMAPFSNVGNEQELVAPGVYIVSLGLSQRYSEGQTIYLDDDMSGTVNVNDERLNPIRGTTLEEHTIVLNGHDDEMAGWNLVDFNADELHLENVNPNHEYDHGELIYQDLDNDNMVSVGDMRRTSFMFNNVIYWSGTFVGAFDPELNINLEPFQADERHTTVAIFNGTSMACPYVAGTAALMWILNPDLTNEEIRNLLINTAEDLGPAGWDADFGYGLVRADLAVAAAEFKYSIAVTPASHILAPSGSETFTIQVNLQQGNPENVDLELDPFYDENLELTYTWNPPEPTSVIPTATATLTVGAPATPFAETIHRIKSTYTIEGTQIVRYSNFFSVTSQATSGDVVWIKTSENDDGSYPRAGPLYTSPWIRSVPVNPRRGQTNELYVKVGNLHATANSGPVMVQFWFNEFDGFAIPKNQWPTVGPVIIDNIGPGDEVEAHFDNWFIPSTFAKHICVFAQAWRVGLEPEDFSFNILDNNNIGQKNFFNVQAASPFTTTLNIANPTNTPLFMEITMQVPTQEWTADLCNPSEIDLRDYTRRTVVTPLMIPAGGTLAVDLTVLMPEVAEFGHVTVNAHFRGYDYIYPHLWGFILNVTHAPLASEVEIHPETLNLKSRGRWVTCIIEPPDGYDAADIDPSTVYLEGTIKAEHTVLTEDTLKVKFDRSELEDLLGPGDDIILTVTGQLNDGSAFSGTDTIRVIDPGK